MGSLSERIAQHRASIAAQETAARGAVTRYGADRIAAIVQDSEARGIVISPYVRAALARELPGKDITR